MQAAARWTAAIAILFLCNCVQARCQERDRYRPHSTSAAALPVELRIDINHAGADELSKVPGLTPSWAGRIVRFRPYRAKTDLIDRGILPGEVYDRIKDYIVARRNQQ